MVQALGQVPRGSGEGVGGFGAEPGHVQQGSGEASRENSGRLWCRARSGSTGFRRRFRRRSGGLRCSRSGSTGIRRRLRRKFWRRFWRRFREALVQRQVRFNRVPDKVPEKVWEALVQSQVRFNRVPEKVPEKVSGSLGAKQSQVQRGPEKVAEQVPEKVLGIFGAGLGFAARFRKISKNKTLRLLGIPPKLIGFFFRPLFAKNWGIFDKIGPIFLDKIKAFLPCNALCNEMGIWFGRKLSCPTCPFEASYQTQPGWHSGSISTKPTTEIVSTLEYSWIWHSAKTAAQNDELLRAAMFRAARSSSRQSSSVQLAILGLPRWALRGFGCESFPSGRLV